MEMQGLFLEACKASFTSCLGRFWWKLNEALSALFRGRDFLFLMNDYNTCLWSFLSSSNEKCIRYLTIAQDLGDYEGK